MKRWLALLLVLIQLALCGARAAQAEPATDITNQCRFTVSCGGTDELLDGKIMTYWEARNAGDGVYIEIGADSAPGGIVIEWFAEPSDYELIEYARDGSELSRRTLADSFRNILSYFELNADTAAVSLKVASAGDTIAGIRICSAGELPESAQVWQPPVEKADLMLVSTHQDDEELFFGGTIPYYDVVREKNVVVTYMTTCGRLRRGEALSGLWAMGVRTYPEFLCLKDKLVDSIKEGVELWGGEDAIYETVVRAIRKYRPEVIVTHDYDGEYGHNQHKITARCMETAIKAAADASQYPESAQTYGAWQVKKLYIHLNDTNTLYMDWSTPSDRLGGKTPLEVATLGFKKHASQQKYFSMEKHGIQYDNTKFGLVYTTVGEDVAKNDFLENIPEATEAPLAVSANDADTGFAGLDGGAAGKDSDAEADSADLNAEPVGENVDAEETVAAPALETASEIAPETARAGGAHGGWIIAGIAVAALLIGGLAFALCRRARAAQRRRGRKHKKAAAKKRRAPAAKGR